MQSEVWVLHTRRQSDEMSLYGVFSTKEKTVNAARKWVKKQSLEEDIYKDITEDHGDEVKLQWDTQKVDFSTEEYYDVVSYYAVALECFVE